MTPTEILPDLTADDLSDLERWLYRLPPSVLKTNHMAVLTGNLMYFLGELADLRRQP